MDKIFSDGKNVYNRVVLVRTVKVYIPISLDRWYYRYLRYLRRCLASTIGLAAYKDIKNHLNIMDDYAVADVHGAMCCDPKSFTLVWR